MYKGEEIYAKIKKFVSFNLMGVSFSSEFQRGFNENW